MSSTFAPAINALFIARAYDDRLELPGRAMQSEFSNLDLTRIESFGDNCELGFVLRRLGWEDGSLFRWASMHPECLLATLKGDFSRIYEFDDLVPCRATMVRDLRYGTAWHSGLTSSTRNGQLVFDADEPSRRALHRTEQAKRLHLVEKLRRKFEHPNPVFVIKDNKGISNEILEGIHYQLYRHVPSRRFALLEVCVDKSRAGQMDVLERNRFRGYVSQFAPYERASEGDDHSWHRLLEQALAEYAESELGSPRLAKPIASFETIVLPFPSKAEPSYRKRLQCDLRAGSVRLHHGNEWCRQVDDDRYRLHAREVGVSATRLDWNGIHLPAGCDIQVQAAYAILESKPVRATLIVNTTMGDRYTCVQVVCGLEAQTLRISLSNCVSNLISASLVVEPMERLAGSDRAVIDLAPVEIVERQASPASQVAA